jgi:hypothetical protein
MLKAIRSLSWEVLRKNQISLLVTLFLLPALWIGIKIMMISMPAYATLHYNKFEIMIVLQAVLFLCVILSYVAPSARGMSGGFPEHIFRLPLATWFIALVPIILCSVIVSAFVLAWLYFISGYSFSLFQNVMIISAVSAMVTWLQALIWGFIKAVVQKSMIMLGVLIAIIISLQSVLIDPIELSLLGFTNGIVVIASLLVFGYLMAYLAVARARYSQPGLYIPVADFFNRFISKLPFRKTLPNFKNSISAQDWFEWKQRGWLMPTLILLISIPVLITSNQKVKIEVVLIFFIFAPPYLIAFMGAEYASSGSGFGSGKVDITPFTGTRPLTNFELAMSKLRLIGKSFSISILIIITTLVLVTQIIPDKTILVKIEELLISSQGEFGAMILVFLFFAAEFALCWAIATLFASLALTDNKKAGWVISAVAIAFILFLINVGQKAYESTEYLNFLINSAHLIIILPTVVIGSLSIYFLFKFKKLEPFRMLKFAAVIIASILAFCLLLLWQIAFPFTVLWAFSWLFVDIALLSFLPIICAPLAVSNNRSR